MALKVHFTPADIKANKLLDPAKYGFVVSDITFKPRAGQPGVYLWTFKGITGEAKEVPVRRTYTEDYLQFMQNLISKGFGEGMDEDSGADCELDAYVGRKIWLYIKRGNFNNVPQNEVEGFEPWTSEDDALLQ